METDQVNGKQYLKDTKTGRFLTGNIGGGRKKGSRNLLGEAFVTDLYDLWNRRGTEVLERLATEDPASLVRVVANILPQKFEQDVNIGVKIVRLPEHLNPTELEALYHQPKT